MILSYKQLVERNRKLWNLEGGMKFRNLLWSFVKTTNAATDTPNPRMRRHSSVSSFTTLPIQTPRSTDSTFTEG